MTQRPRPQDKEILIRGLKLHYLDWGNSSAPPLVLVHGLQDCARSWDFFSEKVCGDYRVLALDHRGHGDSQHASPTNYRLGDYVGELAGFIEFLGLDRPAVVGHSAGGRDAMVLAAVLPSLVGRLVIVDIDPDAVNPTQRGMHSHYLSESDEWDSLDAVVERLRSREPNASQETLRHHAQHMTREIGDGRRVWKRDRNLLTAYERPDTWHYLKVIQCPALVVRGAQSQLLTHEVTERMCQVIAACRLAELEGGGHWCYDENPQGFLEAVQGFLQEG